MDLNDVPKVMQQISSKLESSSQTVPSWDCGADLPTWK